VKKQMDTPPPKKKKKKQKQNKTKSENIAELQKMQ
jgi:hypothetical protein